MTHSLEVKTDSDVLYRSCKCKMSEETTYGLKIGGTVTYQIAVATAKRGQG